jgi:hypothetical protein
MYFKLLFVTSYNTFFCADANYCKEAYLQLSSIVHHIEKSPDRPVYELINNKV